MRTLRRCACWGLVLLLGCGRGDVPLAPVQGQVLYHGQPLHGGTIVFTPDPERGGHGPQALAEITSEGRFLLSTEGRKGATPGWHRVTIAPSRADRSAGLPPRYLDPDQSGQCLEVKSERLNLFTLNLE
jgi:hypothetical protein